MQNMTENTRQNLAEIDRSREERENQELGILGKRFFDNLATEVTQDKDNPEASQKQSQRYVAVGNFLNNFFVRGQERWKQAQQNPETISPALAIFAEELAGGYDFRTYSQSDRHYGKVEGIRVSEGRRLFTEVGKRVFPDVGTLTRIDSNFRQMKTILSQIDYERNPCFAGVVRKIYSEATTEGLARMQQEDTETLLERVESHIGELGEAILTARNTPQEAGISIAIASKALYGLELMRTNLEQKLTQLTSPEILEPTPITKQARIATDAKRIDTIKKELGIPTSEERERMQEKIILRVLAEGGARFGESFMGSNNGFQFVSTRGLPSNSSFRAEAEVTEGGRSQDDVLYDHGKIREFICIKDEKKEIMETKKGSNGFGIGNLRLKSTPERLVHTGRFETVMHNTVVQNGKPEPAVRISYKTTIPTQHYSRETEGWRDYSARDGQVLSFEVVLPESIAHEVEKAIDENPAVMRKIVERFAKEQILKQPEFWDKPYNSQSDSLRPPYERWDAESGGLIYVKKAEDGLPYGWNNQNVRRVKR